MAGIVLSVRWMLFCSVFAAAISWGQALPKKSTKAAPKAAAAEPGMVSGRVFLITGSGDLKPARLAKVHLFQLYKFKDPSLRTPGDTAGSTWDHAAEKAALERWALARDSTVLGDSVIRLRELLSYEKALVATLDWGREQNKTDQFWSSDADEEGNFKITDVRPGEYILVARGRAGYNDAFWQKDVTVKAGMETTLKLSAPEKACLVILQGAILWPFSGLRASC